jgi:hypothetical protein
MTKDYIPGLRVCYIVLTVILEHTSVRGTTEKAVFDQKALTPYCLEVESCRMVKIIYQDKE